MATDTAAGTLLNKRYRIEGPLGQGGFSTTWRAVDIQSNQPCVIKKVILDPAVDQKNIELFEREAKVLAQLNHPQIPKFIDFFELPGSDGFGVYLVQQYIDGRNLNEIIRSGRRYTEKEAIELALSLLAVLEYLHAFSPPFIHRDIKPSNIVVTPDGRVFLIDFGAVRDKLLHDQEKHGGGSTFIGTHGYIPYEQYAGRALPATDLYALGMTLAVMMTGKDPADFEQREMRFIFRPHLQASAPFTMLLEKLTEPEWQRRYTSVKELREALLEIQSGRPPAEKMPARALRFFGVLVFMTAALWFAATRFAGVATAPESGNAAERSREHQIRRSFPVQPPATITFGTNIVRNPELYGPDGWEFRPGWFKHENIRQDGNFYFCIDNGMDFIYQDIDISRLRDEIRGGGVLITVCARMKCESGDGALLYCVPMRNETISDGTLAFDAVHSSEWTEVRKSWPLPPLTRRIKIVMKCGKGHDERKSGKACFDDISLMLTKQALEKR